MLNAHSEIIIPPEIRFVHRIIFKQISSIISLSSLQKFLREDEFFPRMGLSIDDLSAPFESGKLVYSPVNFYCYMLALYARKEGENLVGDKDPRAIDALPIVKGVFPDVCILHIVRDPRDVFLSRTKADWSRKRLDFVNILAYYNQFRRARKYGRMLFGENYMEIRYEDLVRKPKDTLQRICDFLSLNYEEGMLSFQEAAKSIVSSDDLQWHGNLLKSLRPNNSEKWRIELSVKKVKIIEAVCGQSMELSCYEFSGYKVNFFQKLYALMWRLIIMFASRIYDLYLQYQNRIVAHLLDLT